ncbi:lipid A ethanolaminephosphotransferase [Roseovarius sp. MBR-78]|jgi:lipid A ethanolaminephosphotransferase|uniref:phosphoethanolamine transferase n=1 Tax=Roseovarius sp. MBR-78 TaxID=3156460 RepID=UPI0033938288
MQATPTPFRHALLSRLHEMRPRMSGIGLALLTSIWLLAAFNISFWTRCYDLMQANPAFFALFVIAIWALTVFYLLILGNRWLIKPFLIANIFIAAAASYFHETLGIIVDREMIQNTLNTTANEAGALVTPEFLGYMAALAVLPSLLILAVRVTHRPLLRSCLWHVGALIVTGGLFLAIAFSNYQYYSFALKQSRGVRGILHPIGPVRSVGKYVEMIRATRAMEFQPVALNAHNGPVKTRSGKPTLMVLVVGETLRNANWGLSGYARDTTPELRKRDVVNLAGVRACGTSTSVSIPCMFSNLTREEFSYAAARSRENLLDVLARAGYDIEWWDANTGDMGVAERVPYTNYNHATDPEYCVNGECNDGILTRHLSEILPEIHHDTVIVMHQIGNHGPAYFERYPPDFARFLPECRDPMVANCSRESVINAYDNAVAYTDRQLSRIIDLLDARPDLDTSLVYVSDHGESLGESGLYLHAAPYWIAPSEQTTVPMVLWMSAAFRKDMRVRQEGGDGWT